MACRRMCRGDYDVRAEFIRYLALGGCDACGLHEKGLRIVGARIIGVLDLEGGDLPRDLGLFDCRFEAVVVFRSATVQSLFLNRSSLSKGLSADRLVAKGDFYLRVWWRMGMCGCKGRHWEEGLDCTGATFNAVKDKDGRQTGYALSAEGLEAKGSFFLRAGASISGRISLSGARVGALVDEAGCWPEGLGQIDLDRFRYDAILGYGPVDAKTRIAWLAKLDHDGGFSPQPYEQLAKVLREMGHREDARAVLIETERLQRAARRLELQAQSRFFYNGLVVVKDIIFRNTIRYGYRPFWALGWLGAIMVLGMFLFSSADGNGAFKPNDSRVWLSKIWEEAAAQETSQVSYFLSHGGESYPAFNAFIYSADVLLPIVDFDMQDAWIPDEDKAPWVRAYMWLHMRSGGFLVCWRWRGSRG